MPGRTGYGLVGAVVVALIASGCSANEPDAAQSPAGGSTNVPTSSSRPSDLSLAGKPESALCALLSPEQQTQLSVENPKPVVKDGESDYKGCGWRTAIGAQPAFSISIRSIPMSLAEYKEQELGESFTPTAAKYQIAGGYPAVQSQAANGLEQLGCNVAVDVSNQETLDAFMSPDLSGTLPNQQLCDTAKQAAELAVATLKSQG